MEHKKWLNIIFLIATILMMIGAILGFLFQIPFGKWVYIIATPVFIVGLSLLTYKHYKFKKQGKNKKSI